MPLIFMRFFICILFAQSLFIFPRFLSREEFLSGIPLCTSLMFLILLIQMYSAMLSSDSVDFLSYGALMFFSFCQIASNFHNIKSASEDPENNEDKN